MILAFDLERKRVVLRRAALVLRGFRRFVPDDLAERNRLAQRIDQHIETGLEGLVIEGDVALVEADGADIQRPGAGLLGFIRRLLA